MYISYVHFNGTELPCGIFDIYISVCKIDSIIFWTNPIKNRNYFKIAYINLIDAKWHA